MIADNNNNVWIKTEWETFTNALRNLFLLVSFEFTVTPTGLWHGLTNNPHLDCLPKAGFMFNVQKWPVPESGGVSLVKKPPFDTKPESC